MVEERTNERLKPSRMQRTLSETSPVRHDLTRQTSYDGRVILPYSPEYVHQTYADPSDSRLLRSKIGSGYFRSFVERNNGLLLVAASQVFFAGMNVFAKLLSNPTDPRDEPVSTWQLIFIRMSLTYIFAIFYMWYNKVPDFLLGPKEVRWLLLVRSSVGFMGLFSIYYSLQYLPLSDATVLTFLTPCFTLVLGWLFLGENFTRKEALAGFVALIGVVFIARPLSLFGGEDPSRAPQLPSNSTSTLPVRPGATDAQRLSAVLISLLGVVGAGGAYVTIRYIGKRAHALISVSIFSLVACLFSSIGLIVTKQKIVIPRGRAMLYLMTLGVSGFVAQFLLTMGLQREKAGRGSTAMYLQLLFALLWGKIVFDTTPDIWSLCGMALILGSTVYVAVTTASASSNASAANDSAEMQTARPTNNEEALLQDPNDEQSETLLPVTSLDLGSSETLQHSKSDA